MSLWPWGLLVALVGVYLVVVLALVLAGRPGAARAVVGFVPDCAVMIGRLARDPGTPRSRRIALVLLVAYLASPIDLVPDFIPIAGQLDDAILVILALGWLVRSRGLDALRAAWPGPESSLRVVLSAAGASGREVTLQPMAETILERVQAETRDAMKAGDRERVGALRMLASALQQEAKEGKGDEIGVLRRERKRRLEAADAYREGGSPERAEAEESEAEVISAYLPAELSDEELAEIVDAAIADSGASGPAEMGKAMGAAMPRVDGRADGKRVSTMVREKLGS